MDRLPSAEQLAFERRLTREARRFDLRPLLSLLRERGYGRHDLLFQSSSGGTSPSIIESIEFDRSRARPFVMITLNVGLLGDGSLLPSYFFEVIEQTREPERFYDFIRFFDHRLLEGLVRSLFPEDNERLFRDWGQARRSFLELMGPGSVATMQWLFQLFFPELKVHVERSPYESLSSEHAAHTGGASLDGSGILGTHRVADGSGLRVDLIAEEEIDARGRSWAAVVRQRLVEQVLPRIERFGLPVTVRLHVLNHASWARVEQGGPARGYLGYDRIQGEAEAGHAIVVYPDPALLRSVGTAVSMLKWLFGRSFPEFDARAESFLISAEAVLTETVTQLRASYPDRPTCALVELTLRTSAFDAPSPATVHQRLHEAVLPVLRHLDLAVVVRLKRSPHDRGSTLYPERAEPTTVRPGTMPPAASR